MKCTECRTGTLSRTSKPDALGRFIESCSDCSYRRIIPKDAEPAGTLALRSVSVPGSVPAKATREEMQPPTLIVGEPCPTCHRKVTALPRVPQARFCTVCGDPFTRKRGEKLKGLDVARCPKHRAKAKAT